jgi:DNA-binding transcriptional LysR family regulator
VVAGPGRLTSSPPPESGLASAKGSSDTRTAAPRRSRAAALGGRGVADLPTFLVGPDIAAGRLRIVLGRFPQPDFGVHALYPSNRYLAAKTRAFVDFLARRFGDEPEWDRFRTAGEATADADGAQLLRT